MTHTQREATRWLLIAALTALLGGATGLASGYQGAARHDREQDREIGEIRTMVERIDARVSEMYCADKPPGCR